MVKVDALFFDLDGTLIDSKRDLAHSVQYVQSHYGTPESTVHEVGTFIGDGVVKLVERALPQLPSSEMSDAVALLKSHYREHCLDFTKVSPGVRATLDHFRGKTMAVVTNKPVRISGRILEGLGLSSYFEVLIGGDSLPNKKPHPEPILNAMKTLGLKNPRRIIFVGDSENDVRAGKAAKTRTCGIKSNIGDPKILANSRPDWLISDFKDLMRIFS